MKMSSTTMLSPDQSLNFGSRITCHTAAQFFGAMSTARARFKSALRQCRLDEQMIRINKLANYMQCHDLTTFGKKLLYVTSLNPHSLIVLLVKQTLLICGKITIAHY